MQSSFGIPHMRVLRHHTHSDPSIELDIHKSFNFTKPDEHGLQALLQRSMMLVKNRASVCAVICLMDPPLYHALSPFFAADLG